jgi:hypothetical protein
MARWKCATATATASRHLNVPRRRIVAKAQPSAELMVDPGRGTRCAIRDTGAPGEGRYHWTVTVSRTLVQRRRGALGSLRRRGRGQRAGRVAAHPLTLCLFYRRIETQCHNRERSGGGWEGYPLRRSRSARPGRVMIAKLGDLTRDERSTHNCPPFADTMSRCRSRLHSIPSFEPACACCWLGGVMYGGFAVTRCRRARSSDCSNSLAWRRQ